MNNPFQEQPVSDERYNDLKKAAEIVAKGLLQSHPELDFITVNFGWVPSKDGNEKRPVGVVVPRDSGLNTKHLIQLANIGQNLSNFALLSSIQQLEMMHLENETKQNERLANNS